MNFRPQRVAELIRHELGTLLMKEIEIDGAMVTLTEVVVSKKLDHAAVHVSVLPSEKSEKALFVLRSRAGHLQYLLNRILNIKPMPHLEFMIDHGPEDTARVEKILMEDK